MRCNICDRVLETPDYNRDLEAYEPCPTCLAVITDAVGSFGDKPYAEEDDLVEHSPTLDSLYTDLPDGTRLFPLGEAGW